MGFTDGDHIIMGMNVDVCVQVGSKSSAATLHIYISLEDVIRMCKQVKAVIHMYMHAFEGGNMRAIQQRNPAPCAGDCLLLPPV